MINPVSSFWFKAWEWSADCSHQKAKITADQGLSDTINTGHFILLSCMPQWVSSTSAGNTCTHLTSHKQGHVDASTWKSIYYRHRACFIWLQQQSFQCYLFITLPKQVGFYLVAVYTLHNERNDFVCYSKILQHRVHCCVCRGVREQFNIVTINICIMLNYLLFVLV